MEDGELHWGHDPPQPRFPESEPSSIGRRVPLQNRTPPSPAQRPRGMLTDLRMAPSDNRWKGNQSDHPSARFDQHETIPKTIVSLHEAEEKTDAPKPCNSGGDEQDPDRRGPGTDSSLSSTPSLSRRSRKAAHEMKNQKEVDKLKSSSCSLSKKEEASMFSAKSLLFVESGLIEDEEDENSKDNQQEKDSLPVSRCPSPRDKEEKLQNYTCSSASHQEALKSLPCLHEEEGCNRHDSKMPEQPAENKEFQEAKSLSQLVASIMNRTVEGIVWQVKAHFSLLLKKTTEGEMPDKAAADFEEKLGKYWEENEENLEMELKEIIRKLHEELLLGGNPDADNSSFEKGKMFRRSREDTAQNKFCKLSREQMVKKVAALQKARTLSYNNCLNNPILMFLFDDYQRANSVCTMPNRNQFRNMNIPDFNKLLEVQETPLEDCQICPCSKRNGDKIFKSIAGLEPSLHMGELSAQPPRFPVEDSFYDFQSQSVTFALQRSWSKSCTLQRMMSKESLQQIKAAETAEDKGILSDPIKLPETQKDDALRKPMKGKDNSHSDSMVAVEKADTENLEKAAPHEEIAVKTGDAIKVDFSHIATYVKQEEKTRKKKNKKSKQLQSKSNKQQRKKLIQQKRGATLAQAEELPKSALCAVKEEARADSAISSKSRKGVSSVLPSTQHETLAPVSDSTASDTPDTGFGTGQSHLKITRIGRGPESYKPQLVKPGTAGSLPISNKETRLTSAADQHGNCAERCRDRESFSLSHKPKSDRILVCPASNIDIELPNKRLDLNVASIIGRTASDSSGGGNKNGHQHGSGSATSGQSGGGSSESWGGARPKSGKSGGDGDDRDDPGRRPPRHTAAPSEGSEPDMKRREQKAPLPRNYKRHRKKQHGRINNEQMCHCLGQAGLGIHALQQSSGAGELDCCVALCLHDTGTVLSPTMEDLLCCSCAMLHSLLSHFASAAHDTSCHLCLQLFTLVQFHMLRCRAEGWAVEDQDMSANVCHKIQMAVLFEDVALSAPSTKIWVKVRKYLSAALGPILVLEVEETDTQTEEGDAESLVSNTNNNYGDASSNSGGGQDVFRSDSMPPASPASTSIPSAFFVTMSASSAPSPAAVFTHPAQAAVAVMPKSTLTRRPSRRLHSGPYTTIPEEPASMPSSSLPVVEPGDQAGDVTTTSSSSAVEVITSPSGSDDMALIYAFAKKTLEEGGRRAHFPSDPYETNKIYGVGDNAILSMPEPRPRHIVSDVLLSMEMKPKGVPGIGEVVYGTRQLLLTVARNWRQERDECRASGRCRYQHHEEGVILAAFKKELRILHTRYQKHHQWERLVHLGNGVTGKCHLCIDRSSNFKFCCKKMHILSYEDQELDIWSELSHPNVVRFFGAIRHGEKIYMFAEFIDGGSLAETIKEQWVVGRRLSHWMALNYFRQILETLTYLQSVGILHEDIKADNLLLKEGTTEIILADFGVAQRICHDHAPRGKSPTGSPAHWAPEKASSEGHGFPSDVWAAACVLIHMLSGSPPWISRFPDAAILNYIIWSKPAPVDDIPENVKESVRDLIACCLVKDAAIRPPAQHILQHQAFQLLDQSGSLFSTFLPPLPAPNMPSTSVDQHVTPSSREEDRCAAGGTLTVSNITSVSLVTKTSPGGAEAAPQGSAYSQTASQSMVLQTTSQTQLNQGTQQSHAASSGRSQLVVSQASSIVSKRQQDLSAQDWRLKSGPASLPAVTSQACSELKKLAQKASSGSAPSSLQNVHPEASLQNASMSVPTALPLPRCSSMTTTTVTTTSEKFAQKEAFIHSETKRQVNVVRHITMAPPDLHATHIDHGQSQQQVRGSSTQLPSDSGLLAHGGDSDSLSCMQMLPADGSQGLASHVAASADKRSLPLSTQVKFSETGSIPVSSLKQMKKSFRVNDELDAQFGHGPQSLDLSCRQRQTESSAEAGKAGKAHGGAAAPLPTPEGAQPEVWRQNDFSFQAQEAPACVSRAVPLASQQVTSTTLLGSSRPLPSIAVPSPLVYQEEQKFPESGTSSLAEGDGKQQPGNIDNNSWGAERMQDEHLGTHDFLQNQASSGLSPQDFKESSRLIGLSSIPEDKEGELSSTDNSYDIHTWQYYHDQLGGASGYGLDLSRLPGKPTLQLYRPGTTPNLGQTFPVSIPNLEELLQSQSISDSADTLGFAKNTFSSEEKTIPYSQATAYCSPPAKQADISHPLSQGLPQAARPASHSLTHSDEERISSGDLFGSGPEHNTEFSAAAERRQQTVDQTALDDQLLPLSVSSSSTSPSFSRKHPNLRLDVTTPHAPLLRQRSKSESKPKKDSRVRRMSGQSSQASGPPDSGYSTHMQPQTGRAGDNGAFFWRKRSDATPLDLSPLTSTPLSAGSRSKSPRPSSGSSTPHSTYDKQEQELSTLMQTMPPLVGMETEAEEEVSRSSSDQSSDVRHLALLLDPHEETSEADIEETSILSMLQESIQLDVNWQRLMFLNDKGEQLFSMRVHPRNKDWKDLVGAFRGEVLNAGYHHFMLMHKIGDSQQEKVDYFAPIDHTLTSVTVVEVTEDNFFCWCESHLIH